MKNGVNRTEECCQSVEDPSVMLRWSFGEESALIGGKGATQKDPIAKNETRDEIKLKKC